MNGLKVLLVDGHTHTHTPERQLTADIYGLRSLTRILFKVFLSGTTLILWDFKIHVCCPTKPLVKDVLNLTDCFSLVQSALPPTSVDVLWIQSYLVLCNYVIF